jgi:formylglycine-generating enzyme required for sulfatase activity
VEPAHPVLTNSVGMRFRLAPPGRFLMGSPDDEVGSSSEERPRREVNLTRPFWIAETVVTQAQYRAVMGAAPSHFSRSGDGKDEVKDLDTSDFPVENVTSDDAMEFCRRLSEKESALGRRYRLPSEAEWEYGCRGGAASCSPFHFGHVLDDSRFQANFNGGCPYGSERQSPILGRTCPVRRYPPNALGLFDMHGNVEEWCADWYGDDYYTVSPMDDPPGPEKPDRGNDRVPRGGCWSFDADCCRSACRNWVHAFGKRFRSNLVGFRAALVVDGIHS